MFATGKTAGLGVSLAAALVISGCGGGSTSGGSQTTGGQGGLDGMGGTELAPSTFATTGGFAFDAGGRGAPGGNVDVVTTGGLSFGPSFAAPGDAPAPPADAQRIASLDADVSVTGTARIDGNVAASGPRRITVSGGDLFITGKLRADSDLTIEAPNGSIYVTGTIDTSGTSTGGKAGDIRISADGNVLLVGAVKGRGGAASAAAALAIDAGGGVQLAGTIDLRGGAARDATSGGVLDGGAGGHLTIGAVRPPASVVSRSTCPPMAATAMTARGRAAASRSSWAETSPPPEPCAPGRFDPSGGSGDGGLAGNFTMDINTIVGSQSYRPGSVIMLDGGGSGGVGTAGGGGHLYGRSYDGIVTMSGSLFARGGTARDGRHRRPGRPREPLLATATTTASAATSPSRPKGSHRRVGRRGQHRRQRTQRRHRGCRRLSGRSGGRSRCCSTRTASTARR